MSVEREMEAWLESCIRMETGARRRERLMKGLGYSTVEFLQRVWYPAFGHFEHLQPEWEVRDLGGGYRYLDLAYMPGGAKGGIELQGYGPHARDLDLRRFKDLCMRHSLLALDGWTLLLVATPSIVEETKLCQQLVLAFAGRFATTERVAASGSWLEAEILRYARRVMRPFSCKEVADHVRLTDRHIRRVLRELVDRQVLCIVTGKARVRAYRLTGSSNL